MSRINNIVKFLMINLNIITSFIGLGLFGLAFYFWFADWGDLDKTFFESVGGLVFLFGLSMLFGSCVGCQGISNQTVKFGKFYK
ncbi:hypothetical protein EON63_01100 [archaeon]|nr:MAG: hypothetical protein EON63_01100 [archaeon]